MTERGPRGTHCPNSLDGAPRGHGTFCLKTRRVADQTATLGALTVPQSHFKVDADGESSLEGVSESIRLSDGAVEGRMEQCQPHSSKDDTFKFG